MRYFNENRSSNYLLEVQRFNLWVEVQEKKWLKSRRKQTRKRILMKIDKKIYRRNFMKIWVPSTFLSSLPRIHESVSKEIIMVENIGIALMCEKLKSENFRRD